MNTCIESPLRRWPRIPWPVASMALVLLWMLTPLAASAQPSVQSLSLEEAYRLMQQGSLALQQADEALSIARQEHRKAEASWWPTVQAEGAYVAMANDVGVDFTLLDRHFSYPILRRRFSDISLSVSWPLFTGGQRWWGTRMARRGIRLAALARQEVGAQQQLSLINAYFALSLARSVTEVRRQTFESLQRHYADAVKTEGQGMLTHADVLYARLNRDEAEREWQSSLRGVRLAEQTLSVLMGRPDTLHLLPTTSFFVVDDLPADWTHRVQYDNLTLQSIDVQSAVAKDRLRMSRSAYLPTVALLGRQSVQSYHLPKNLLPHTMVGVGFTWTLFDGFRREAALRQSRLQLHTLQLAQGQTRDQLQVLTDNYLNALHDARATLRSLDTAVALAAELSRMRAQAFHEGMATNAEVVDARVALAAIEVARLGASYEYVAALAMLCTLAGTPELFWQLRKISCI